MEINLLNENDVIASDTLETSFHSRLEMPQTFRVKELQEKIRQLVVEELQFDFDQLVECQVLRPEQTEWKTGSVKVKLAVTFVEDSTESSIDLGKAEDKNGLDQFRSSEIKLNGNSAPRGAAGG